MERSPTEARAPEGWAEALDEGLADVAAGRVVSGEAVLAEIDAELAAMRAGMQDGDGQAFAVGTAADRGTRR